MDFFRFANILFRFINFLYFFFWYYLSSIDLLCCKFGSIFFSHLAHSHYDLCDFYIIFLNLVDSFLSTEHFFKVFFSHRWSFCELQYITLDWIAIYTRTSFTVIKHSMYWNGKATNISIRYILHWLCCCYFDGRSENREKERKLLSVKK